MSNKAIAGSSCFFCLFCLLFPYPLPCLHALSFLRRFLHALLLLPRYRAAASTFLSSFCFFLRAAQQNLGGDKLEGRLRSERAACACQFGLRDWWIASRNCSASFRLHFVKAQLFFSHSSVYPCYLCQVPDHPMFCLSFYCTCTPHQTKTSPRQSRRATHSALPVARVKLYFFGLEYRVQST